MSNLLKAVVSGMAFVAISHASASAVVSAGAIDNGIFLSGLSGTATLNLSNSMVSAANAIGLNGWGSYSPTVAPAGITVRQSRRFKYTFIQMDAPVGSIDFTGNGASSASIDFVSSLGGIQFQADEDGLTNSGGFLAITNLSVDLKTSSIYADLSGGNGLGKQSHVHLLNYAVGPVSPTLQASTVSVSSLSFSGLSLTHQGFDQFVQALGLYGDGVTVLSRAASSMGSLTFAISANVAAIPEPSQVTLMGAGLAALAFAARRRARKQA